MLLFILIFSSLLKLIIFSRLDISLTDLSLLLFTICSVTMVFLTLPVSSNLEYTVSFLVRAFTGVIKKPKRTNTAVKKEKVFLY